MASSLPIATREKLVLLAMGLLFAGGCRKQSIEPPLEQPKILTTAITSGTPSDNKKISAYFLFQPGPSGKIMFAAFSDPPIELTSAFDIMLGMVVKNKVLANVAADSLFFSGVKMDKISASNERVCYFNDPNYFPEGDNYVWNIENSSSFPAPATFTVPGTVPNLLISISIIHYDTAAHVALALDMDTIFSGYDEGAVQVEYHSGRAEPGIIYKSSYSPAKRVVIVPYEYLAYVPYEGNLILRLTASNNFWKYEAGKVYKFELSRVHQFIIKH